jgi:hypothetical protein
VGKIDNSTTNHSKRDQCWAKNKDFVGKAETLEIIGYLLFFGSYS